MKDKALAHLDPLHSIVQCNCRNQTIQLRWGRTKISFQHNEFEGLVAFLSEAYIRLMIMQKPYFKQGTLGVMMSADNTIQLWLYSTGLHMTPYRFLDLYGLTCTALKVLKEKQAAEQNDIDSLSAEITDWLMHEE